MKYKGKDKQNEIMSPIYDKDPSGLTCTCPHNSSNEDDSWRRKAKDEIFMPKFRLSGETQFYRNNTDADSDTASSSYKPRQYRRSVSLGQILNSEMGTSSGHYSDDMSSPIQQHSDGLTSRGSTVYPGSSSDASPDGNGTGHELSDFEKENLLFLKDLDNNKSFRPIVDTGMARPLQESLSYSSLASCSEDSLTGDSTPRGGSPYPGRKEFTRSTYSPAKKAPSGIMRSISREEPEDDLSDSEASRDDHKDAMLLPRGGRKISLPPLSFSRTSSTSSLSSTGGCGPAWWNTRNVREVPPRRSLSPGPGTVARARRIYSYRSLSSPGDYRLLEEEPVLPEAVPWRRPRTPIKFQDPPWRMEETLQEDSQDTEQEPNKKNHIIGSRPVKSNFGSDNGTTDPNVRTPSTPSEPPTSNNVSVEEAKKPSPMAFTVDLGGGGGGGNGMGGGSSEGGETGKKLDIGASISKWAPKHRRNLSLTKVEENKVEESVGKPPVGRPRSGTVGSSGVCVGLLTSGGRRIGGYHSEGYFSSDQDDDQANKRIQHTDLKSPRSPKTPELRSPLTPQRVARSISQDSAKGASLRKHSSKSECEAYSPNEKKSALSDLIAKTKEEPVQKPEKMTAEVHNMTTSIQSISSCQTYDVNKDELEFNKEVVRDDVSEAGTYTIEKDSSSPEVEQARNNIDQVFGVSATESETDNNRQRPVSTATEDNWELNGESDKYKCSTSLSRSSPNWIQQWAAQVAEHTKAPDPLPKDGLVSPRGSKAPLTSLSSSQESSDSRPRRKLPTPPAYTPSSPHASVALTSSRTSDISDHETSNKSLRDPYDKPRSPLNPTRSPLAPSRLPISQSRSPHGQKSLEYLRDSECFLRDTQQLMTSLQARVNKGKTSANRGLSLESHDSGGDSDIDTSTSYANTDQDSRLSKALKNKMKSTTIDSLSRQIAVVTSPKRTEVKSGHHLRRERSSMSEVGYDAFAARHDDKNLQSDSSSETSEHAKDCRKNSDNNPPLKFNRAFSLRKARLDEPPQQKIDKKKNVRPSSAGTNSRRTPLSNSKSSQGEYGIRGTSSQATTPKSNSSDFSRGDGGRFSLRLPRSASTTAVAKSPSKTSVKKELQHGVRKNMGSKSNSTMSSKEADFQNWKRRKSYDPMKAAAEGRRKQLEIKDQQNNTQERTPSPEPLSLLRSQSFHGPEGMAVNNRWPRRPNNLYGSEEEGPYSLEEEQQHHVPQLSPIRRSPTSPHHLSSSSHSLSPHRQAQINAARRRGSYTLSDEGETNGTTISRKTSLDESGSEGKRSPMGSTRGGRSKAKSEALDNLVISTIHSLSVKVRTTSETLLQKLKSQYDEDGDRAALLEDVLAHLSESDQALSASQTHSTSRELAGILRNLKKIENALQVIDQVMLSDDEEEQDDDEDLEDGTDNNHWGDDY